MRVPRLIALCVVLGACTSARSAPQATQPAQQTRATVAAPEPFPSTYRALPSRPTLITNATILTAAGPMIQRGAVLLRDGKVAEVGANLTAPADAQVIDANGKWVTPGIIDTHSHLGVYAAPGIDPTVGIGNTEFAPGHRERAVQANRFLQQ